MAVSVAAFKARFPILATASDSLIGNELAAAALNCNAAIWGSRLNDGIAYLTAHRICMLLPTEFSRLVADGETMFGKEYMRLQGALLVGDRCP